MAKEPVAKKPRKPRKPMTPEQKAKAAKALEKARAKREAANPPQYKSLDPDVVALPDDSTFSRKNVMDWIKRQKEEVAFLRKQVKLQDKGAEGRLDNTLAYIRELEYYLKTGIYVSGFYGADGKSIVKLKCIHPSYDRKGNLLQSYGVDYSGI